MQHQIQRWNRDHTAELHTAWMNGSGMMVWENVFGTWVGWNEHDRAILRAMLPLQRRFASLFSGEGWTPLVETEEPDMYASLWEGEGLRLWTLVNRSDRAVEGILLTVPRISDNRYFDLIFGQEIRPLIRDGKALLPGRIPPRGIGAFVAGTGLSLGKRFLPRPQLNLRMNLDTTFPARTTTLKPVASTEKYGKGEIPAGMVEIPAASFGMKVVFRVRECGFYDSQMGDALRNPGLHRPVTFERKVNLSRYAIDLTPVTNAQFAEFVKSSGYKPKYPKNFLKHWQDGSPPSGKEDHPAVYVDLGDARAYAKWARKRLPTEEEWQYAAQGPDALRYPWGNDMKDGVCNAGQTSGTTSVTAFPDGRSPFGCYDMCGNVYEWTESERSDGRTRFCIIRGGSHYKAKGSDWYADGGPQPCNFAVKFLLMWPGLDRCATIGFRCVVDLADE
jgi:formylglycine-generating enzyme required for sulfatase activity